MDVHFVFDGRAAEFIRRTIGCSASNAAPGQNRRKRFCIVITARIIVSVAIANGLSAKFASPNDQSAIEKIPLLEIADKRRQRLINILRAFWQSIFNILVMIPAAGPNLNEPNATFNQPPRY